MDLSQIALVAIVVATIGLFLWGRWRHDLVALASLLSCVIVGVIPAESAFSGFGHPAVITVACVLILSAGLEASGAVQVLAQKLLPRAAGPMISLTVLALLGALLSAFMNNVGAMAMLMPLALQVAARHELPPGRLLMPLAFATIFGGMTTLIGTPPNLIVAGFRAEHANGAAFTMFDFAPVGLAVAGSGLLFLLLLGWRLVPVRSGRSEGFDTARYMTEVRVSEGASVIGKRLREVDAKLEDSGAQVVALIRNELRMLAPSPGRLIKEGDLLVLEAEPDSFGNAIGSLGLKLEEEVEPEKPAGNTSDQTEAESEEPVVEDQRGSSDDAGETGLGEYVVMPHAMLVGRTARDLQLRTRFGINLLAISRHGDRRVQRLRTIRLEGGDVLLLQGSDEALAEFASEFECVPLAPRAIHLPDRRQAAIAALTMLAAVALAASGWWPAAISFAAGALLFGLLRIVPLRRIYQAIDWPVIVLLAALIPVANALSSTGVASLLADLLVTQVAQGHAIWALALVLVVTMTLSDFMNNAATAAVMCPIAIGTATTLGVAADPFLMAVAIGGSCAFLTPIGHQNNTLILGPGGFRFGDYWRLGLPLEALVVAIGLPCLLYVWPLSPA
ncbi:MAG: SLC13 family permease [Xanthomonadales bacterium]|nr:SLC13 family permease [Xanthomonadales bacterium]